MVASWEGPVWREEDFDKAFAITRWTLERVVEMAEAFMRRKEDSEFDKAFTEAGS